jgi:hypothetical protein
MLLAPRVDRAGSVTEALYRQKDAVAEGIPIGIDRGHVVAEQRGTDGQQDKEK